MEMYCASTGVNQNLVAINLIRVSGRGSINPAHYHADFRQGFATLVLSPICFSSWITSSILKMKVRNLSELWSELEDELIS